ncbi:MAG: 3-oxo-tetronate kinase [Vicinamibacterales bacterium]
MQFGAIADDITGGTDLASAIRQTGLTVLQTIGVPRALNHTADVVIVSLKTRTAPVSEATEAASTAAAMLRAAGAAGLYFKYCSTFDSTDEGNIGPVIERLLDDLSAPFAMSTPAYPELGRTVYLGHLFVGDRLLSESSMRNHPLTPMRDANLVRVLGRQCRSPIGLVPFPAVEAGARGIRRACGALEASGHRIAIADAISPTHLRRIAESCASFPLVSGAAGLGRSLAQRKAAGATSGPPKEVDADARLPAAVLSGSCSSATQAQVQRLAAVLPSRAVDPLKLAADERELTNLIDWACDRAGKDSLLVYSTANPGSVREVQRELGRIEAAAIVESTFRALASALAQCGVRTFIVAGGETSGAVLEALDIRALTFGSEIEPGVPWTFTVDPPGFRLALKSGNFGSTDFFSKAIGRAG